MLAEWRENIRATSALGGQMPHPSTKGSRFMFTAAFGHDFSVSVHSGTEQIQKPCGLENDPFRESADIEIPKPSVPSAGPNGGRGSTGVHPVAGVIRHFAQPRATSLRNRSSGGGSGIGPAQRALVAKASDPARTAMMSANDPQPAFTAPPLHKACAGSAGICHASGRIGTTVRPVGNHA